MSPAVAVAAVRKVRTRLVTFLALLYFAAFIDRVNVGFAAAQMQRDLGFSPAVYGLGAGIFFLGYCLFEVPSNLILHRLGARRWIGRIMISWGLIAAAMAGVRSAEGFYTLRLLLGIAEAGLFPGVLYYLTYWLPASERARLISTFMMAIPLSTALSGPLSSTLLALDGSLGLAGWQWLFLIETIPSLVLGGVTLWILPDVPAQARWLSDAERRWLGETLSAETPGAAARSALRVTFSSPRIWALAACYCGADLGLYGVVFWIPQILAAAGIPSAAIGYAVAVPYATAAVGMLWWARHSDRSGERVRHMALAAVVGFTGLAASALVQHSAPLAVLAFTVGVTGSLAMLPIFWTLPAALLRGAAAAASFALINAIGNIGSFAGPYLVGWIKEASGSFTWGLITVAAGVLVSGVIALAIGQEAQLPRAAIPAALEPRA
jgi:ACS family tartrate transporter-like MFS transporter